MFNYFTYTDMFLTAKPPYFHMSSIQVNKIKLNVTVKWLMSLSHTWGGGGGSQS
jgi:hypothetical protein